MYRLFQKVHFGAMTLKAGCPEVPDLPSRPRSKRIGWGRTVGALVGLILISTPVMGGFGSNLQNFAQVVVNQGSSTSFTVNNPSPTETITVDLQLYLPDGRPLADQRVELGPGATETLLFGEAGGNLTRGWAELRSDNEFIATEFFQLFVGQLKPRVGVLPSLASREVRFAGFVNSELKSGVAVHNPSPTEAAEITVRVTDKSGQQPVPEKQLRLAPLQSEAGFLNEALFFGSGLANYEGVVEIRSSSVPVAAVSLIQEASGNVATVSVVTPGSNVKTETSNTAVGVDALKSNTTGADNTATGAEALTSNTQGNRNTALGRNALGANTTGEFNTALGAFALRNNTEASQNTAVGDASLNDNTSGQFNTAMGAGALTRNTEGDRNTAIGQTALFSNTSGRFNTAVSGAALFANTTGTQNTAVGDFALNANTTGDFNAALGNSALLANTTGSQNTAIGHDAMRNNTEGSQNTAVGISALSENTSGEFNTAVGRGALFSNADGAQNTAIGDFALHDNSSGHFNTVLGATALSSNTTGSGNTAVGDDALLNSTGSNNIAVGFTAGQALESGDNDIYVGNQGAASESNIVRIGNNSQFLAGVQQVGPSSQRFKKEIRDMDRSSGRLMELRPVTFRYREEAQVGDSRLRHGLIAEEVFEILPELVLVDETGQLRTVLYQELNSMLLNELQKQQRQIQGLTERLERLEEK